MKMTDYPSTQSLVDNNIMLVDGPNGTKSITAKDLSSELLRINNEHGGSGDLDILDTKEEIEANTTQGKVAGALAVKQIQEDINNKQTFPDGVGFYPDVKDGVRGYNTDAARGADTFHPFSGASGTLNISFEYKLSTNGSSSKNTDVTGTMSIKIEEGVVKSKTVTGGIAGIDVINGSTPTNRAQTTNFRITSAEWISD